MAKVYIASFESKTRGTVDVYRGCDEVTRKVIYEHSQDPGNARTLGSKDLKRFSPDKFPEWIKKGGGRFMFTAWNKQALAGLLWIGGESFPTQNFPKSPLQPRYTIAWRTGYSTPEGGTFEGEGIAKRLGIAGITDVVELTCNGGPEYTEGDEKIALPPLAEEGLWLDTGINNTVGQALYHHLGFTDIGIYTPHFEEGKSALELEPRVGMIADSLAIRQLVSAAGVLLNYRA